MKNSIRIFGCAIFAAFYCLAVSAVSSAHDYSDFVNKEVKGNDQFHSSKSIDLFSHTTSSESSVANSNGFPIPVVKKSTGKLWTSATTSDEILATQFTQYSSFALNFLIQLRKAGLVFPFHYFW